jgi:hypothetical protein
MADNQRTPRYQELEKQEFKSGIPTHLFTRMGEQEKYVVNALSRMEAQNEWIVKSLIDNNRSLIETDLRMQELQDWKAMVSSKWGIVGAFLLCCCPVVIKIVIEHLLKP